VSGARLVQLAVLGPAAAGLLWLVLAPWRWPRRLVGGAVALASHGAAWWVFWLAYLGEGPGWRGLSPSLVGATVVAAAEVGVLFAVVEAERRSALSPALMVGLGASATGLALAGYTGSLVLLAVAIPVPTLAVAATAVLSPGGHRSLVDLAGADVLAVLGLSVVFERTGTSVIGASTGLGVGLLLAAAAIKAGAVPGIGTARLVAGGGASSVLAAVLRGQGILLAAVAGLVMAGGQQMVAAAISAAIAAALAGAAALLARSPAGAGAAVIAAGAAVPFLAIGLGGGFGARAFLVAFPAFLLAAAVVQAALPAEATLAKAPRRRLLLAAGILTAGVALGSIVGAPPGGSFPGIWMGVSVAVARGTGTPAFLLLAAGTLLGLALALAGSIRLLRVTRLGGATLALSVPAALALLYAGLQPVRLGVGWWLRVEESLGLPVVLLSAGGPTLPPVGGMDLLLAVAPGVVLVLAAVALGRGIRLGVPSGVPVSRPVPPRVSADRGAPDAAVPSARPDHAVDEAAAPAAEPALATAESPNRPRRSLRRPVAALSRVASKRVDPISRLLRSPNAGLAIALAVEAAALVLAVRLLVLGARAGFL
jgi:hypothetical protein